MADNKLAMEYRDSSMSLHHFQSLGTYSFCCTIPLLYNRLLLQFFYSAVDNARCISEIDVDSTSLIFRLLMNVSYAPLPLKIRLRFY